jgi:predicted nucleic acid-binding protein
VAAATDGGVMGKWAAALLDDVPLAAPHHMPVEAADGLRNLQRQGEVPIEVVALAHEQITAMGVTYYSYDVVAPRVWELRQNVTPYDAWYVALAEYLEAPLATLDVRLTRAPGPRCDFLVPPT